MAQKRITTFADDAIRQIAESVRRLQAQYRNIEALLPGLRRDPVGRDIRTGVTGTNATWPTYPSTGCTFVVQFEDWNFLEAPGTCGLSDSYAWPARHVIAQVYGGEYLAEGTRVFVVRVPSRSKGLQYWILPATPGLVRFELLETLCRDGSALAVRLSADGLPVGDPFTIYDTVGQWHGAAGFQGWATWQADGQRWEVVFLEALARFVEFELLDDVGGGCGASGYGGTAVPAQVLRYWGAAPNHRDPGATINVYDRAELYPHAMKGARGFAVYDEQHVAAGCVGRYVIWTCDQMTLWGTAQLDNDMCPDTYQVSVSQFERATWAPFGQDPPAIAAAVNWFSLAGQYRDRVALYYSDTLCEWVIVQVTHKEVDVVVGLGIVDGDTGAGVCPTALQAQKRTFAMQYCDPTVATETVLTFQTLTVVVDVFDGTDASLGDCLQQTVQQVWLPCAGDQATETIICFSTCPTA